MDQNSKDFPQPDYTPDSQENPVNPQANPPQPVQGEYSQANPADMNSANTAQTGTAPVNNAPMQVNSAPAAAPVNSVPMASAPVPGAVPGTVPGQYPANPIPQGSAPGYAQPYPQAPAPGYAQPYPQAPGYTYGNLPPYAYEPVTPARLIANTKIKALTIALLWLGLIISTSLAASSQAELQFSLKAAGQDPETFQAGLSIARGLSVVFSAVAILIAVSVAALIMWAIAKLFSAKHPLDYSEALLWILVSNSLSIIAVLVLTLIGQDQLATSNALSYFLSLCGVAINTVLFLKVAKAKPLPVFIVAGILGFFCLIGMIL